MKFDLEILGSIENNEIETFDPRIAFKGLEVKLVCLNKQRGTLLVRDGDQVRRLTLSEALTKLVRENKWSTKEIIRNKSVIIIGQDGVPFLASKPDLDGGWETV